MPTADIDNLILTGNQQSSAREEARMQKPTGKRDKDDLIAES
jgi:hypothetical protein